jgi:TolA-binding protein
VKSADKVWAVAVAVSLLGLAACKKKAEGSTSSATPPAQTAGAGEQTNKQRDLKIEEIQKEIQKQQDRSVEMAQQQQRLVQQQLQMQQAQNQAVQNAQNAQRNAQQAVNAANQARQSQKK